MFLPDDLTMKYVESLTKDPSPINIKVVAIAVSKKLPDQESVAAELELIAMAVEPVHPGITERLRAAL